MVFLDHVQNLHIHAVRAKILRSIFGLRADVGICPLQRANPYMPYRPPNMYGVLVDAS